MVFGVLALSACSTQKAQWTNIQYHNISCHYNVWWNGNESLKEGLEKLSKEAADDYTQVLPVYQLGTQEQSMRVKPQMDKAIEKGLKGIKKHSIYQKGREYVPYVKNCYMLTAYGSFYEQDYAATDNTCRLIISQYSGTPEADEAKILLARSFTQQKQYFDAEVALEELVRANENGELNKANAERLYLAMVECLLPQEKYKKGVEFIRQALEATSDRTMRARLYFIMAQIYHKLDKKATATKYYNKVLKSRPPYVMEFNARIGLASCSDMSYSDVEALAKSLDRMLRDKKNEEFKDQIYYAKGDMYLGVKDAQKACDNYKLSVAAARNNPKQKAKSALKMAEVLYDVYENYDAAQSYYDTAMRVIKPDYPHYDEIRERYNLLTSLVEYTRAVNRCDSLIAISQMDSASLQTFLENKVAEVEQREAEERERKLLEELEQNKRAQTNTLQGDWYFYNSSTVEKGSETFRKRWGMRLLEDYWALSNHSSVGVGTPFGSDEEAADTLQVAGGDSTQAKVAVRPDDPNDPHSFAYYLKDVPTTDSAKEAMQVVIADGLLNAGYIYYDGIKNTTRALGCYLRITNDYPENNNIAHAFFQLYRIYSAQGNTPSANYYRDMVLMGFPDSDYANLIRDDQYYLEIVKREHQAQDDYAAMYSSYRRRRYGDALQQARRAIATYSEEPLVGKFRYWAGLSQIRLSQLDSAEATFQFIVAAYPDTSRLVALANEQLDYLRNRHSSESTVDEAISTEEEALAQAGKRPTTRPNRRQTSTSTGETELPEESNLFRYRETMQHYVIVVVNDKKIVATQLQYKIADFNELNYANSGYRSSPIMFTDTSQMITIHRFMNAEEAMRYYKHLLLDVGPLKQYDPRDYVVFAISTQNYATFYNRKNVEAYAAFFRKYYLNEQ